MLYHELSGRGSSEIDRDLDLPSQNSLRAPREPKTSVCTGRLGLRLPYRATALNGIQVQTTHCPLGVGCRAANAVTIRALLNPSPANDRCPACDCASSDEPAFPLVPVCCAARIPDYLEQGSGRYRRGELLATGWCPRLLSQIPLPCQPIPHTNSAIAYSVAGRIYRVNSRRGQLFSGALGTTTLRGLRLENQWIDQRFQADDEMDFTPQAESESVAIVSPKTTDVLRIRPATVSPGLLLDPLASAGIKAAYYSAAFILRFVAAEELDVDPDELDISM